MDNDFSNKLLRWYAIYKRDLPWRKTTDPYTIWISEIILQQTRIDQGLPYFYRFIKAYPDVRSLAFASEDEVLKLWQGLGYYSRARNMHHTARKIVNDFNGIFPSDYHNIRKLKGIGDYTASLIASVSFNQPFAVLDGNVFRVLARLNAEGEPINTLKGKRLFQQFADKYLDQNNPGDFNQAMMELGAMICMPKNPECKNCPVSVFCKAYKNNIVSAFPVKTPKEKLKERFLNFILIRFRDNILIEKRKENDIWKGLYQLPLFEKTTNEPLNSEEVRKLTKWNIDKFSLHSAATHLLTHRKLIIRFYVAETTDKKTVDSQSVWIETDKLNKYAFPKPIERFLNDFLRLYN